MIRSWPLYFNIGIYLGLLALIIFFSLLQTDGIFISPLDDTYIHLAIAKNFGLYGVWGITPYEFSSSSSSLFWTLGLSVFFRIFGDAEWIGIYIPLALNILAGLILINIFHKILRTFNLAPSSHFLLLLFIIIITPLPPLTIMGMEHIFHSALALSFLWGSLKFLEGKFNFYCLPVLSFLLMGFRYESIFLIGIVCFVFWFYRRWREGIFIGIAGAIVPISYAFISLSQGWLYAPNSILIKGNTPESILGFAWQILQGFLWVLPRSPGLFAVVIVMGITFYYSNWKVSIWKYTLLNFIVICSITLHSIFADVGWLNRYEGYLIPFGLVAIAANISEWKLDWNKVGILERRIVSGCIIVASILSLIRISNIGTLPQYQNQIYIQQYQMGQFIEEFYDSEDVIVINDIGWVSYLGNSKIIDIWGLGHLELGKDWINGEQNIQRIDSTIRMAGADLIMVYDAWLRNDKVPFHPGMPKIYGESYDGEINIDGWIRIATWKVPHIYQLGDNIVSFYALDKENAERGRKNLIEFQERLPNEVSVTYF